MRFTSLSIPSIFFVLISCSTLAKAARFDITNHCPYTVWAAAVLGNRRQLDRGQTWPLEVKAGTKGRRVWARTNCNFERAERGSSQTSNYSRVRQCQAYGKTLSTLAEFALNQYMNMDIVDMSLINGFNLPMEFSSTSGGCNRVIKCTADIIGQCSAELKVSRGCNGPWPVFKTNQNCCNSGSCGPIDYSRYFKQRCPNAHSFPKDDATVFSPAPEGQIIRLSSVLGDMTDKQLHPYTISEVPRQRKPCNRCIRKPSVNKHRIYCAGENIEMNKFM